MTDSGRGNFPLSEELNITFRKYFRNLYFKIYRLAKTIPMLEENWIKKGNNASIFSRSQWVNEERRARYPWNIISVTSLAICIYSRIVLMLSCSEFIKYDNTCMFEVSLLYLSCGIISIFVFFSPSILWKKCMAILLLSY